MKTLRAADAKVGDRVFMNIGGPFVVSGKIEAVSEHAFFHQNKIGFRVRPEVKIDGETPSGCFAIALYPDDTFDLVPEIIP